MANRLKETIKRTAPILFAGALGVLQAPAAQAYAPTPSFPDPLPDPPRTCDEWQEEWISDCAITIIIHKADCTIEIETIPTDCPWPGYPYGC